MEPAPVQLLSHQIYTTVGAAEFLPYIVSDRAATPPAHPLLERAVLMPWVLHPNHYTDPPVDSPAAACDATRAVLNSSNRLGKLTPFILDVWGGILRRRAHAGIRTRDPRARMPLTNPNPPTSKPEG